MKLIRLLSKICWSTTFGRPICDQIILSKSAFGNAFHEYRNWNVSIREQYDSIKILLFFRDKKSLFSATQIWSQNSANDDVAPTSLQASDVQQHIKKLR